MTETRGIGRSSLQLAECIRAALKGNVRVFVSGTFATSTYHRAIAAHIYPPTAFSSAGRSLTYGPGKIIFVDVAVDPVRFEALKGTIVFDHDADAHMDHTQRRVWTRLAQKLKRRAVAGFI